MQELSQRACDNLAGRISGRMSFHLVLQPLMAAIVATIRGGACFFLPGTGVLRYLATRPSLK